MRAAANEKLRKLSMLIRSSKAEANAAVQNTANNSRRKYNPRSPGWYDNFRNESFHDAFYRYRTTYYDKFSYPQISSQFTIANNIERYYAEEVHSYPQKQAFYEIVRPR